MPGTGLGPAWGSLGAAGAVASRDCETGCEFCLSIYSTQGESLKFVSWVQVLPGPRPCHHSSGKEALWLLLGLAEGEDSQRALPSTSARGRQGPDCRTLSHRVTFLFLSSSSGMSSAWVHPLPAIPQDDSSQDGTCSKMRTKCSHFYHQLPEGLLDRQMYSHC